MSDYPTLGKYRIIASKWPGEPAATLLDLGDDLPVEWGSGNAYDEETIWYFEPDENEEHSYYIRNFRYTNRYMGFEGEPEDKKGLVGQFEVYRLWKVEKVSSPNSFCMRVSNQDISYFIAGEFGGQLTLDTSGYLNLHFQTVP